MGVTDNSFTTEDKVICFQDLSADKNGALFCYISQEARRFCDDVKPSRSQPGQFYSYQACATPERNICINSFYNQEKEKYAQDKDGYLEKTRKAIRPKTNVGGRIAVTFD